MNAVADCLAGADVYLETSYKLDVAPQELPAEILERHDPDRMVFGTDSPLREQKEAVELVNRAFPDPEARRKVLSENAGRQQWLRQTREQNRRYPPNSAQHPGHRTLLRRLAQGVP